MFLNGFVELASVSYNLICLNIVVILCHKRSHHCVLTSPPTFFLLLFLRALSSGQCVLQRSDIRLLSPVLAPEKVVCVGMNYRDHCLEQDAPIPKEPIIFSKFPSAITGPYDDIILPPESQVGNVSCMSLLNKKKVMYVFYNKKKEREEIKETQGTTTKIR